MYILRVSGSPHDDDDDEICWMTLADRDLDPDISLASRIRIKTDTFPAQVYPVPTPRIPNTTAQTVRQLTRTAAGGKSVDLSYCRPRYIRRSTDNSGLKYPSAIISQTTIHSRTIPPQTAAVRPGYHPPTPEIKCPKDSQTDRQTNGVCPRRRTDPRLFTPLPSPREEQPDKKEAITPRIR